MADTPYQNQNFVLKSLGIVARNVDDACEQGQWLNEDNCEELAENSVGTRLGTALINAANHALGAAVFPLPASVTSLSKLNGLNGQAWRYAGSGTGLYRRTALSEGEFQLIASNLSGQPWQSQAAAPTPVSSNPYNFFADSARMAKDNGTLAAPQNMGIAQPQYPVSAEAQSPDEIILDSCVGSAYTTTGTSTFNPNQVLVSTTLAGAVTETGIQEVAVANPSVVGIFQSLVIDTGASQETVLVLFITSTGIIANFTKTHAFGAAVKEYGWTVSVAASGTGTIGHSFAGRPILGWPTTLNQEDYIGLYLFVSDPSQVLSITLKFDCGDGTFNSDYFYKVIAQGPLQQVLASAETGGSTAATPTTLATDAVLDESLGLYNNSAGGIAQLKTGLNNWSPMLLQLSDFAGAGRADFNDPVFNWGAVNGYQLSIVMNDNTAATVELASLVLFGGYGPDTFAGVAYDYMVTFYNNVDGTESNPSMEMSNINPPNQTNWVYPRRQPVLLTLTYPTVDPQTTSLRIYRRGGTLGDNYRRVDEVLLTGSPQTYLDVMTDADIEQSDFVSFTNDVPVTSTLQTPVNTTLLQAIPTTNSVVRVYPVSMANISVAQQVSLGTIGAIANNFETVVVLSLVYAPGASVPNSFMAFVQNSHLLGEQVSATAKYGQPVTIIAQAFGQFWFAGDPNNPNYLYFSASNNPQYVSSAAYVQVSTSDDPITVVVGKKGNLYVSTVKAGWFSVAPGSNENASPTVYPTACKHGCVAPLGWVDTEEGILYQANDGIRFFEGGASAYLTQALEFIFQQVGSSPIVEADLTKLSQTRGAYWNNMVFFSYVGVDGKRHRVILHTVYKRWRNDDIDAQSLLLEADTNNLLFGSSDGLVHLDRQIQAYDEGNNAGVLVQNPISMNLQTPYTDFGMPAVTKSFQELTLDIDTAGQTLLVYLWFEDGEVSQLIGTVNTSERQKVNYVLNNGLGYEYYKVSIQIAGNVTQFSYTYQIGLRALALAKTRKVMDTFWLRLGTDESKFAKDIYIEYTASQPINFEVFYDDSSTAGFTFTLPVTSPSRQAQRVRLPAVSFRMIRIVGISEGDFQIWTNSKINYKPQKVGSGYQVIEFVPD